VHLKCKRAKQRNVRCLAQQIAFTR
jgi:hypothetical protein